MLFWIWVKRMHLFWDVKHLFLDECYIFVELYYFEFGLKCMHFFFFFFDK